MSKKYPVFLTILLALVFVSGISLGRYHPTKSADTKIDRTAQCNTELHNWQAQMNNSPYAADFTNIKIYKAMYSQVEIDCVVATYGVIPAHSPAGADTEYIDIDSLSAKGLEYWSSPSSSPVPASEAMKILDEQLERLR